MTDQIQRNFRSAYLEKVGIKGVEEKKSLEILLKEQPLDISKLMQFCLRFPVPTLYRPFLWKVLLGILPPLSQSHEFVWDQRCQQYNDLREALFSTRRVTENTPLSQIHLCMYLIEDGILPFDQSKMFEEQSHQIFIAISTAISQIIDDPIDVYWMTRQFYRLLDKQQELLPIMREKVEIFVKREDTEGKLYNHLKKLQAFNHLPLNFWFQTAYASVLPENSFERIWDKIIGGSCKVLVYVAVSILTTFKRPILSMNNMDEINRYLTKIPEDSGDIIVSKATESWQKHGSLLTPVSGKSESPSILERTGST